MKVVGLKQTVLIYSKEILPRLTQKKIGGLNNLRTITNTESIV